MTAPRPRLAPLAALVLLAVVSYPLELAAVAPTTTPAPLVVIVAASSKVREISRGLLRRIFLGEPTVYEGDRLIPLNYPPGDPLRTAFDASALGLSPDASARYWIDRRIRGQGLSPRAVSSSLLLREVVAKLPGGIGYIRADQLAPHVRALEIDGTEYDEPDYPLAHE